MLNAPASPRRRVSAAALLTPARLYAVSRMGIGLWLLVQPDGFGAKWFTGQDPVLTGAMTRADGGTDLAIGVGLLFAQRPRRWLWLCAVCDFLDAFAVFLARSRFSDREVVSGVVGAAGYGLLAIAIAEVGARRRRAES